MVAGLMLKKNNSFLFFIVSLLILGGCMSAQPGGESVQANSDDKEIPSAAIQALEGYVQLQIENEGTLSEYRYYTFSEKPGGRNSGIILFQKESMKSRGFESYVGRRVRLTGTWGQGTIDWRNTPGSGLLVHSIELVE